MLWMQRGQVILSGTTGCLSKQALGWLIAMQ
jgi:hypothetical protein